MHPETPKAEALNHTVTQETALNRRRFLQGTAAVGSVIGLNCARAVAADSPDLERLKPIGRARGIHPGRVMWIHDPQATNWKGPGDGHWYEANHTRQDHVDAMMARAVCELTGQSRLADAWDRLFRHLNQSRGKGNAGYKPGEKLVIKPNWVGMIWREGAVDPESYTLTRRQDYMNTSPQMIIAVIRQLVEAIGVKQADICVCDTLAYLVNEYYDILHGAFSNVQYVDYAGKSGRIQARPSATPLYWSCRPKDVATDYVPACYAEAEYIVNLASLKAHARTGVTLCGKNHFGSLVRWPVQPGYYDMHRSSFLRDAKVYREQVDVMGHAHFGGKTVLYLIDGLYPGKHSIDSAPRKWSMPPFDGNWASSLLASQDPVAIDSVGYDFLWTEWTDCPRQGGAEDYLHEAALADNPPSGVFYDPDHPTPAKRLPSLGVHEHWNNSKDKKYSRNLGIGEGIELLAIKAEEPPRFG